MARTFFNKQSLALVAALALPFAVSACYAMSIHARTTRVCRISPTTPRSQASIR